MRRVVAGLAITVDGVVESPSESGWMRLDAQAGAIIEAGIASADAILLGRRTYLGFAELWPRLGSGSPMGKFMNSTPKFVLSSTLRTADWPDSTLLRGPLVDEVVRLKAQPGRNIQVPGSPRVVRSLLSAGLLDELALMVHPVVLGVGQRLFDGAGLSDDAAERLELELVDSTQLDSGVVAMTYRPA